MIYIIYFSVVSFIIQITYNIYNALKYGYAISLAIQLLSLAFILYFVFSKKTSYRFKSESKKWASTFFILIASYLIYSIFNFSSIKLGKEYKVKSLGFENEKEMLHAFSIDTKNKEEYEIKLNAIEAKEREIEEIEKEKLIKEGEELFKQWALEREQEEERLAIEKKQRIEKDIACRNDLKCTAEAQIYGLVPRLCKPYVEAAATYDFEWTDGFLGGKFSHFEWKNKERREVTYIGDKVKFQNGFGAWVNMIYYCDINLDSEKVTGFRIDRGRIK